MKGIAILILFALIMGLFVAPSMSIVVAHEEESAINTLDICNAGIPALSAGGEMPCMHEGIRDMTPALFSYASIPVEPVSPYSQFSVLTEHPPQA